MGPAQGNGRCELAVGLGLSFIVARDGSPVWQVMRVIGVAALVAVILRSLAGSGRAARSAISFAVGVVGTAIGVGIGLPHLARAGIHPMTVAGVLTLSGAITLLVVGAASLTRPARSWRRVAAAPSLLVTAIVAVWTLGPAVAATNVSRTSVGSTIFADVGLSYREVELPTDDGVTLSGWYIPSVNDAAVVILHGAGATRSGVLDHAVVLARHGYGVLLFDARGHGRSGGRAMDFGWSGDADIAAAVSFLQSQPDVDNARSPRWACRWVARR